MRHRGPIITPDGAAILATTAVLAVGTALLLAVDPAAAAAWLGSTVLMSWRRV